MNLKVDLGDIVHKSMRKVVDDDGSKHVTFHRPANLRSLHSSYKLLHVVGVVGAVEVVVIVVGHDEHEMRRGWLGLLVFGGERL